MEDHGCGCFECMAYTVILAGQVLRWLYMVVLEIPTVLGFACPF